MLAICLNHRQHSLPRVFWLPITLFGYGIFSSLLGGKHKIELPKVGVGFLRELMSFLKAGGKSLRSLGNLTNRVLNVGQNQYHVLSFNGSNPPNQHRLNAQLFLNIIYPGRLFLRCSLTDDSDACKRHDLLRSPHVLAIFASHLQCSGYSFKHTRPSHDLCEIVSLFWVLNQEDLIESTRYDSVFGLNSLNSAHIKTNRPTSTHVQAWLCQLTWWRRKAKYYPRCTSLPISNSAT